MYGTQLGVHILALRRHAAFQAGTGNIRGSVGEELSRAIHVPGVQSSTV